MSYALRSAEKLARAVWRYHFHVPESIFWLTFALSAVSVNQLAHARAAELGDLKFRLGGTGIEIYACPCDVCDVDSQRRLAWSEFTLGQFGPVGLLPHVDCLHGFCECKYVEPLTMEGGRAKPGNLKGRHYTTYVDEVKRLRREGSEAQAERLLLALVDAVEAESEETGCTPAPWYFEQLAIIYRKRADYEAEVEILSRYVKTLSEETRAASSLVTRLEKAQSLDARAQSGK